MKSVLFKVLGFTILTVSVLLGVGWKYMTIQLDVVPVIPPEGLVFEIQAGETYNTVTDKMSDLGIAPSPIWNRLIARKYPQYIDFKAAEYLLTPGMSYAEILERFTSGKGIQYSIRFVEGWTVREVLLEMQRHRHLKKDIELTMSAVQDYLGIDNPSMEGWLFPDTYYFQRDYSAKSLLQQMYARMQNEVDLAWSVRHSSVQITSPYELLIMASLIEKETGLAAERETISGVFHRRLHKGMRLQTDPTVIYALGDLFDGNLRRRDLRLENPYNTYRNHGLPPTPIAVPSTASLVAAGQPEEGTALYFVSRGDGSHVFSDTLAEHNRAVRTYQLRKK